MYIGKYCHDYLELYHLSINKTEFIKREPVLTFYIISIKKIKVIQKLACSVNFLQIPGKYFTKKCPFMYFNVSFITLSRQPQLNVENGDPKSDPNLTICLSFLHYPEQRSRCKCVSKSHSGSINMIEVRISDPPILLTKSFALSVTFALPTYAINILISNALHMVPRKVGSLEQTVTISWPLVADKTRVNISTSTCHRNTPKFIYSQT